MKLSVIVGMAYVLVFAQGVRAWSDEDTNESGRTRSTSLLISALCTDQVHISADCMSDLRIPYELQGMVKRALQKKGLLGRILAARSEPSFVKRRENVSNFFSEW